MILYQFFINTVFVVLIPFSFVSKTIRNRIFPKKIKGQYDICMHGTSLGESILILKLLSFISPLKNVYISTSTKKSYLFMKDKLKKYESQVSIGYIPIDTCFHMGRFLKSMGIKKLFIIEHDMWPNMLAICKSNNIKTYLLNTYIKRRDFRNYFNYSFVVPWFFNFHEIYVQNDFVKKQLKRLKVQSSIKNIGNLKYMKEALISPYGIKGMRSKVVTLGSFHSGEENIWQKHVRYRGDYSLVVIPRHLEYVELWYESFSKYGKTVLLSEHKGEDIDIIIVDEWGLSKQFYALSDVVVIGDSFHPTEGGHNIMEPFFYNVPVVYGKFLKTFSDITKLYEKEGIFFRENVTSLSLRIEKLIHDDFFYKKTIEKIRLKLEDDGIVKTEQVKELFF